MTGLVRWICVATLCAAGLAAQPGPARGETLADALSAAYINSGLLEQNRALLRAADEDVAQAVADLRPIIDWSADIRREYIRTQTNVVERDSGETNASIAITGSLLLYDFGRSDFLTEAAKETVLATRQTLRSVEQAVLLTAVRAYMDVIRNREFVLLRRNNLELLREELRAARNRFEVGEVTRTDVAQAEAAVALAQSGLAVAEGDLTRAVEEFREAVGRPPGDLQTPQDLTSLGTDVAGSKAAAMRRHPDILEAQRNVAAAELNMRAAAAAKRPRINLTGRLGNTEELDGSDFSRSGSVGIELRGPIYRGGRLTSLERQARAQRDQRLAQLHLAGLRVRRDVGDAFANLRAARAGREANREAVRAARVAFEGTREEATLGARTTLDVLDSEQDLLDAEANLISASADVVVAAYSVLEARGELTAQALNLGVQTYDPSAYYDLVKDAPVSSSAQGRKLDRVLRALNKD